MNFWKLFRITTVVIFFHLLRVSFFTWDGFRYYGSFPDFLAGIALLLIFWSILAAIATFGIWIVARALETAFSRIGWKIRIEHMMMVAAAFLVSAYLIWLGRSFIKHYISISPQIMFIILALAAIVSILLTIPFRNKVQSWMSVIQERITPIVWLSGIFYICSFFLIIYQISTANIRENNNDGLSRTADQVSLEAGNRPNIILVTFDSLATRDMSVYGYHRNTTPFITKWAKNATLFTMHEAASNYTTAAVASLMTSKRPWTHQLYHAHGYMVADAKTQNLPFLLKKHNYYTIALVQNSFALTQVLGIADSFDVAPLHVEFMEAGSIDSIITGKLFQLFDVKFHTYNGIIRRDWIFDKLLNIFSQNIYVTEHPSGKVFARFLEIINNTHPEPYFAWLHIYPPHYPYLAPAPYMGMFDSSKKLNTAKSQVEGIFYPENINVSRARYDEYIRYCDETFEDFIKVLSEKNILRNSVIILSADHGESFEHNYLTHGGPHLYEQVTNIPLIIKLPEQTEGMVIDNLVEQIDISPTILELTGIPKPAWMEGQSLLPLIQHKVPEPRTAISMSLENLPGGEKITDGTFALWDGDLKLIHYLSGRKSLLYNLRDDPDELNNLIDKYPEAGNRLLDLIEKRIYDANKRINGAE